MSEVSSINRSQFLIPELIPCDLEPAFSEVGDGFIQTHHDYGCRYVGSTSLSEFYDEIDHELNGRFAGDEWDVVAVRYKNGLVIAPVGAVGAAVWPKRLYCAPIQAGEKGATLTMSLNTQRRDAVHEGIAFMNLPIKTPEDVTITTRSTFGDFQFIPLESARLEATATGQHVVRRRHAMQIVVGREAILGLAEMADWRVQHALDRVMDKARAPNSVAAQNRLQKLIADISKR